MRQRRSAVLFIPFSALLLILFLLWPSDEKRITKLFGESAKAVRVEDIDGIMSRVSLTYKDDLGLTYLSLGRAVKRLFASLSDILVEYEIRRIAVSDSTASAELHVRVIGTAGGQTSYVLGDVRTPERLIFALTKEKGRWLITRCDGLAGIVHLD